MALGSMASLGIGSNVLNWDTINQLKDNDIKNQINPITKKIETNLEKQKELTALTTLATTLNTSLKKLSDFSTFQKRSTSVEGNGIKATAGDGLAIQDIKINVSKLAQNDVNQVGLAYNSRDSVFSNKNTTIDFYHNGTNYSIDVKAGATLAEVAQSITDATNGAVIGVIMKTGGTDPYRLMIQSKESGKNQKIYFGSTLESAAMPGGQIKSGTLKIEIGGETLDVSMNNIGKLGNTSEQNAQAVLDAINQEVAKKANLKAKVDSGEITIGLSNNGKGLMLNDSKGGAINVTTTDIKVQAAQGVSETDTDLGFSKKSAGTKDIITSRAVQNGQLSGKITINGQQIDLSNINTNNNAEKVAEAINQAFTSPNDTIKAEVKDGKLVINSKDGSDIIISAEGDDATKAKTLSAVGLTAGTYSSTQNFLKEMNITNIQKAQNAELTYNGIKIEREKNSIDDIISGLSLELTAITETNKDVIVRISRDDKDIADEVEAFVKSYNEMYNKIQELVKYDAETKVSGVFNGNSEMRSMIREFNSLINSNINGKNLFQFGISLNTKTDDNGQTTSDGTLKFDKEKFNKAYKDDPEAAIAFFRSSTQTSKGESVEVDGIFTKMRKTMDSFITGSKSKFKLLESSLTNEQKTLNKDKKSTQDSIDTRYEILAAKWAAYDQIIAKTQQSANTLMQMIQQSTK